MKQLNPEPDNINVDLTERCKAPSMVDTIRLPRVAVLMSTYNGEAFLVAQLDSISAQEGVEVEVFVRDDGSTDKTLSILATYADKWNTLGSVTASPNLGPAQSFLSLLRTAPKDFDYYAFSDQDDVWLPDKLSRAVGAIAHANIDKPALYCSSWIFVDRDLNRIGSTNLRGTGKLEQIIFANIAGGNTMVMNTKGADVIRSHEPGSGMIMHDWWCILVIAAVGVVLCDNDSRTLYRQHGQNTMGSSPGRISALFIQLKQFLNSPRDFYPIHAQTAELIRLYGDRMGPREKRLAEDLVASRHTFLSRIRYGLFGKIVRFDVLGSVGTRVLILSGLY